jgi:cellulose synthase/poly-beta-1,6-N-acetylglucosamine synthase-like glycosyltransferase
MRVPLSLLVIAPATLAACDAAVRGMLWWKARGRAEIERRGAAGILPAGTGWERRGQDARAPSSSSGLQPPTVRILIVVPARAEGDRLDATLASAVGDGVDVLLLLDGPDAAAEANAQKRGVRVVVKTPGGPSKAAALAWLAREHRALILEFDVVLILDAGSRLAPRFFEHFVWPGDAAAAQTFLSGTSRGVGAAAAASESIAQNGEDRGREACGWNVRLRGTGSAFRAATFLELMPRLVTRVEDHEATLLLTANGDAIRMLAPEALVLDDKPDGVTAAASQRARWLLGRYELLVRRLPELARVIVRRPLEGLAFFVEIFGRPLSLTAPLRLIATLLLFRMGRPVFATALALTVAGDVALHSAAHRRSPGAVLRLAGSWLLALLLAPKALVKWMRP